MFLVGNFKSWESYGKASLCIESLKQNLQVMVKCSNLSPLSFNFKENWRFAAFGIKGDVDL